MFVWSDVTTAKTVRVAEEGVDGMRGAGGH